MTSQPVTDSDSLTVSNGDADKSLNSSDADGDQSRPVLTDDADQSRPVIPEAVTGRWLSLTEAVTETGTSDSTIRRRLRAGVFPHAEREPVGNGWRIPLADLQASGLVTAEVDLRGLDGDVLGGLKDDAPADVEPRVPDVVEVAGPDLDELRAEVARLSTLVDAQREAADTQADLRAQLARAEAQAEERAAALVRADRTVELLEGTVAALNGRLAELGEAVAALAAQDERRPVLLQHLTAHEDREVDTEVGDVDVEVDEVVQGMQPPPMAQEEPAAEGPERVDAARRPVGRFRRWLQGR